MAHPNHTSARKLGLLSTVALFGGLAFSPSAWADEAALEKRVEQQEREVQELRRQLQALTKAQADTSDKLNAEASAAAVAQGTDGKVVEPAHVSFPKGAPTFTSNDGQFSTTLHSLVQYDSAWYNQDKAPTGTQLSNGSNFRRAQVGVAGTAFQDWSYNITLDFGGASIEKPGYIYYAYAEYDGLRPFGFRVGALTPPLTIDDATGSGDLVFLERSAAVDVARNIAGGPSREGATIFAQGDRYFAAVSFTGKKVGAAANYDGQEALLGRAAYLAYDNGSTKLLLDAGGTDVLKLPATVTGVNPTTSISLSDTPELTVDSEAAALVATPNFNATHVTQWDVSTAATWRSVSAQGGYFGYHVDLRNSPPLSNPNFAAWYAQATWTLTGEARPYDPSTASFRNPVPNKPLGSTGGLGAWELAARYSTIDLNYLSGGFGTPMLASGVRGGRQDIWTFGLNWYPNTIFHFALDYMLINVDRLSTTGTDLGVKANAVAIRSQLAF